jgi:3-oxoacyl-[acyl-carrier protein] reductase
MDLKLREAAVLVTGASRGLGMDLALAFAAEGARVAICARDAALLEAAAAAIRGVAGECLPLVADLLQPEACRRVVDEAATAFGRLDVLVNNASPVVDRTPNSLEEATDAQVMERVMGKTLVAVRCSRAALPHMRRTGGGRIVCIGGTSARSVFRANELPSGSALPQGLGNSSLANFAKHLSEEAARDGIVVNVVHPHLMRTPRHPARITAMATRTGLSEADVEADLNRQQPIGRLVETSDVVPLVLLLASPLSAGITGQSVAVDGGALRTISY